MESDSAILPISYWELFNPKQPTSTSKSHTFFQFLTHFASSPFSLAQFFSTIPWYVDCFEWHKHRNSEYVSKIEKK